MDQKASIASAVDLLSDKTSVARREFSKLVVLVNPLHLVPVNLVTFMQEVIGGHADQPLQLSFGVKEEKQAWIGSTALIPQLAEKLLQMLIPSLGTIQQTIASLQEFEKLPG